MNQPLAGLLVLEVSSSVSASFAAALLGDFGATVYVAELLPHGSEVRRLVPAGTEQVWWSSIARNKRSFSVDASEASSILAWEKLLACADVVLTDVVEGERKLHPLLKNVTQFDRPLIVDIFPTGADDRKAWGRGISPSLTSAVTGMAALTGWAGKAPVVAEVPLAECLAGAMGAMALMAELAARKNSNRSAKPISFGMHEAVQRMIEWQLPVSGLLGKPELRNGNSFPLNAGISNMHRTADGKYVAISAANQAVAVRLMRLVGGEEMVADERFANPDVRARNMDAIYKIIDKWVGERSQSDVMEAGNQADVVIGPIFGVSDILLNEQIRARGNLTSQPVTETLTRTAVGVIPAVFSSRKSVSPPPFVGQHNDEVIALVERSSLGEEPKPLEVSI